MKKSENSRNFSLSTIMTALVVSVVLIALVIVLYIFIQLYQNSIEQSVVTSSEQAVVQVQNTVTNYVQDMTEIMQLIKKNIKDDRENAADFFMELLEIRSDVADIAIYKENGEMLGVWSKNYKLKDDTFENLSYFTLENTEDMRISTPHVVTLFEDSYPWVVTIMQSMVDDNGELIYVAMDIKFSQIANYVDEVGVGQRGYCFIMNTNGDVVYHPQQQLINSGLKEEQTDKLKNFSDGFYPSANVIHAIHTLDNVDWRIVSVSYVDELITNKVHDMLKIMLAVLAVVVVTAFFSGLLFSRLFTKPANRLANAMGEFVNNAEGFDFVPVSGTREILSLSKSFGEMVVQIQRLMEKVREEEISLRKIELNALQAQINPHFLYNTLDSITWMCEEGRNQEAVEMTSALAKLFRISISKGHELITLEKELAHAQSYLKIQKFRYKSQFSYNFCVDFECLKFMCNKITLQPIIENAIVHGLDMSEEGVINITVSEDGEDIVLIVEDNGVGMTAEKCHEILNIKSDDRVGIGIKNVHDRIRIYFGQKYGLTIKSELDEGTRVEIRIPKILEGDNGS